MEIDLLAKSGEYIREGKFEKAQIILRRILSDDPNQPRAIEMTGDLSLKLGHTQEAVQRYDNASNKYMNANQFAEAILCLEKIRMLEKTNDDVVARLADLYRFYGLPNRSVKTILNLCGWALDNKEDRIFVSGLRKIVELQPRNLPLRLSFSKVLLSIERKQDAHDVLMKLKSLAEEAHDDAILEAVNSLLPQPDGGEELDPKSRIELGNLLYEIGSKDEAIVEFEKAVADLVATGDTEEAISVLNRIMEIDPNNKTVLKKLQDLQALKNRCPRQSKNPCLRHLVRSLLHLQKM
jgi:tetratricopeptide (TPR) repeat protein